MRPITRSMPFCLSIYLSQQLVAKNVLIESSALVVMLLLQLQLATKF